MVVALDDIVEILDADDFADPPALDHLSWRHVAKPDISDEALALKIGQRGQGGLKRALRRAIVAEHAAHVHHIKHLNAEISEVVVNGLGDVLARHCGMDRSKGAALRSHFGDDYQVFGIGTKRLANDLVGNVWAIEV